MTTLAEKETELAAAKASLSKAMTAISYGQGDVSLTRASLPELEASIARLAREVRELQAVAAGATNAGVVTPSWS